MNATPLILALATTMGIGATSAQADYYRPSFTDKARVIASAPVFDRVNEPSQHCWTETIGYSEPVYRHDEHGRAIVGAIAGGLLGSTVGKGSGRVAGAAIGAATGAAIGERMRDDDDYSRSSPRQVEHCQVSDNFHDVLVGYDVVYRFRGQDYNTRLAYDPGRWLDVNMDGSVSYR